MITVAQLNKQSFLAYVSGETLELEGLEASPSEERIVGRREFAEVLCDILVNVAVSCGVGCNLFHLRNGVLADSLVPWPVDFLTILRL